MSTKRIIPCLDVKDGRVVKGVQFVNLTDAGDPVELAGFYDSQGADELVFLDIAASVEGRKTMVEVVKKTAKKVLIPLTVGGGISTSEDVENLLRVGADKVSFNTAAVLNPDIIKEMSRTFGSRCIIVAIDARKVGEGKWEVYTHGGQKPSGIDAIGWAKKAESFGAGEILLTSMDADGCKSGYDIELTSSVSESVGIPVIASGGAGSLKDIHEVLTLGKADAALAASIFHFGKYSIAEVKHYLKEHDVEVRL